MSETAQEEKTATYVVVKQGMHRGRGKKREEFAIGREIELTEAQAASRVGKVVPQSAFAAFKAGAAEGLKLVDAEKKIKQLEEELADAKKAARKGSK